MHGDHTGGNSNFNSEATTIVAHDNLRKRLKEQANITVEITKGKLWTKLRTTRELPQLTTPYTAVDILNPK